MFVFKIHYITRVCLSYKYKKSEYILTSVKSTGKKVKNKLKVLWDQTLSLFTTLKYVKNIKTFFSPVCEFKQNLFQ